MKAIDLIDHVAKEAEIDKKAAKRAVTAFVDGIIEAVKTEGELMLPGFGKFSLRETQARQGRNPSTGEPIEIPAGKRFVFMPAKVIRDQIQG